MNVKICRGNRFDYKYIWFNRLCISNSGVYNQDIKKSTKGTYYMYTFYTERVKKGQSRA